MYWTPYPISDPANFSNWQVCWSTSLGGEYASGNTNNCVTISTSNAATTGSYVIGSNGALASNTKYYAKVRAVNAGNPSMWSDGNMEGSATTTPAAPTGDSAAIQTATATSLEINYTLPADSSTGQGLWDSVVIWIVKSSTGAQDLTNFYSSNQKPLLSSPGITIVNFDKSGNSATVPTIADHTGTIVAFTNFSATDPRSINLYLQNLDTNANYYIMAASAYLSGASTSQYIAGAIHPASSGPYVPRVTPLVFGGITGFKQTGTISDFSQIVPTWNLPTSGDCSYFAVSVTTSQTTPNYNNSNLMTSNCTTLSLPTPITQDSSGHSLVPNQTYWVGVAAVFTGGTTVILDDNTTYKSIITSPAIVNGAGVTTVTGSHSATAGASFTVNWSAPNASTDNWTGFEIIYATDPNQTTACQMATQGAQTASSGTGSNAEINPQANVYVKLDPTKGDTSLTIFPSNFVEGLNFCFVVIAIYDGRSESSTFYTSQTSQSSAALRTFSFTIPYTAPPANFGLSSATVMTQQPCPDGSAQIKLKFLQPLPQVGLQGAYVDFYYVYYSQTQPSSSSPTTVFGTFTGTTDPTPWQIISYSTAHNLDSTDDSLMVGCRVRQFREMLISTSDGNTMEPKIAATHRHPHIPRPS